MNDADWDFLKPWLQILAPVVFLFDANSPLNGKDKDDCGSLQPRVRHLGIDPFLEMLSGMFSAGGGGGPNLDKMQQIGRAMELVALALQVELRVWGLIRDRSGEPLLDVTAYDPKQLGAGLLVKCTGVEMVGPAYAALFVVGDGGMGRMGGMGGLGRFGGMHQPLPYKADRERLEKLFDRKGKFMPSYQIPLAIVIGRSRGDVPITEIQKFFDALAVTMNVETAVPPRMMQTGWTTYRVHDVYVEACDGTRSEMSRLQGSGVNITGATYAHYVSHESLQAIVGSGTAPQLKAIDIVPDSNEGVARLYSALSCGESIGALTVEVSGTRNIKQLAQVLLLTNGKCAALHRLDIDARGPSLDLEACEAIEKAIDIASRGPRRLARLLKKATTKENKVVVVLPDGNAIEVTRDAVEAFDETEASAETSSLWTTTSPIETFSLRAEAADAQAALKIVAFLQRCLPQSLKSLTLGIDALDDACLALIVESFPQLQKLCIKDASVTTAEPLLAAYKDHDCKIQALELGAHGLDVTGLLKALGDPMTRIAKTLKQLQRNCPYDEEPREEFLEALKKMLRANHMLTYVKLAKLGEDKEEISEQLRLGASSSTANKSTENQSIERINRAINGLGRIPIACEVPRGFMLYVCEASEENWNEFVASEGQAPRSTHMHLITGQVFIVEFPGSAHAAMSRAFNNVVCHDPVGRRYLRTVGDKYNQTPGLPCYEPDESLRPSRVELQQLSVGLPLGVSSWRDFETMKVEVGVSRGWGETEGLLDHKARFLWSRFPGVAYVLCIAVDDDLQHAEIPTLNTAPALITEATAIQAPQAILPFDSRRLLGIPPHVVLPPHIPDPFPINLFTVLEGARHLLDGEHTSIDMPLTVVIWHPWLASYWVESQLENTIS